MSSRTIDIRALRMEKGLSEEEFLQKIGPLVKERGSSINHRILKRLESGESLSEDRMQAILSSIEFEFGNDPKSLLKTKYKTIRRWQLSRTIIFLIISIIALSALAVLYYLAPEETRGTLIEIATLLASAATVIALIYAFKK